MGAVPALSQAAVVSNCGVVHQYRNRGVVHQVSSPSARQQHRACAVRGGPTPAPAPTSPAPAPPSPAPAPPSLARAPPSQRAEEFLDVAAYFQKLLLPRAVGQVLRAWSASVCSCVRRMCSD